MKNAQRNNTKERVMEVAIDVSDVDKMMVDRRNGLKMGTVQQMCRQFGISIKTMGRQAILRSRRDGLQMAVEKLHFCRIKYDAMP